MIKDVVVNLSGGEGPDVAADYAISLAQSFGAYVVGVAFVYEPVIPGSLLGGIPTDLIEVQREENTKAGKAAIARFEAADQGLPAYRQRRAYSTPASLALPTCSDASPGGSTLTVVGQAHGEQGASEELLIEGALFGSGRPVVIVPRARRSR